MNAVEALKPVRAAAGHLEIDGADLVLEAAWAPPAAVFDALSRRKAEVEVPLWPYAGMALWVCRGVICAVVARNEIEVIRIGRSIKVVTAPLRKRLGLDSVA